jgi:hypothetical protein
VRHALAAALLVAGCSIGPTGELGPAWDVRGNYALTYDDHLGLELTIAGAARRATWTSGTIDFGSSGGMPLQLDVAAFCARADIACPSEALPQRVSIDQRDADRDLAQHALDVVDDTRAAVGAEPLRAAGLVDHTRQDTFRIDLASSSGGCSAGGSAATGRFTHRGEAVHAEPVYRDDAGLVALPGGVEWPADAPVDGIADGRIIMSWLGACAFAGLATDAALVISTGFRATRTGDYQPPIVADAGVPLDGSAD